MQIGIFSKVFVRPSLPEVLDAVCESGLECVQFSMSCVGLPALPDTIDESVPRLVRDETSSRGITMAAVSGTFNMIHPDIEERRRGLARFRTLASVCGQMGAPVITLCTGTRDPGNMWRRHPDNDSPAAWRDMLDTMGAAVAIAEDCSLTLVVEPEVSNVVDSARKARLMLNEIRSARLKIVIDGANLYHAGELPRMREILDEAFDLLGDEIVMAHAKDVIEDGEAGHEAAGTGLLDYDHYLHLLQRIGFDGALVLHSLHESQVAGCLTFLRQKMEGLA